MPKFIRVGSVLLFLVPAAVVLAGHSGGSHGGGSHGGGTSHSGGSHVSGSHGGGSSHISGSHDHGSHSGSGHGSDGRSRHHGGGWVVYGGPFWGGWGWDCPYYADCYGPPYVGPQYVVEGSDGTGYSGEDQQDDWGMIDTEIWPEVARVYLDGRYIGAAQDFDGSEDYLYLRPGEYTMEFRLKGYEPASMDLKVEPGAKIEVNRKLHKMPGSAEVAPTTPPKPEGGLRRYWGKEGDKLVPYAGDGSNPGDTGDDDDDAEQDQPVPVPNPSTHSGPAHRSTPTARLQLSLEPSTDAVVYLDGHLIGTAAQISRAEGGIAVAAGNHTITITRPGFKSRTVRVEVFGGESKKVELSLEK